MRINHRIQICLRIKGFIFPWNKMGGKLANEKQRCRFAIDGDANVAVVVDKPNRRSVRLGEITAFCGVIDSDEVKLPVPI